MPSLPLDIGPIHFIGIGGIGMSGIAEVMHNLGYKVQGSDLADSGNVKRLRAQGIPVLIGQREENIGAAKVIVYSSAVKPDNPEMLVARERHLPIVRRAEMLAELMRLKWCVAIAGTHGKTTTTTMVATLLDAAGMDPTVINGGIINAYGTNARRGEGEWMVVEADESDGSFLKLPSTIAVVTNIDPEHLDHYGSFEKAKEAYLTFIENIPFYGLAILCIDHPVVQAMIGQIKDRRIITYGFSPQADVRAVEVRYAEGGARYDVVISDRASGETRTLADMRLPMPGAHNVSNSLAAIVAAHEIGVDDALIRRGLSAFGGVKRRFSKTGAWNGVTIIDDYGHHPVEIAAVLSAARQSATGRVIAVVQPHRYTRLRDLFNEFCTSFNEADTVIVADVYAAGEAPIEGFDRTSLIDGLRARGHRHVLPLESPDELARLIAGEAEPGDLVVCLGAGSITYWANALPDQLSALGADAKERESRAS